MRKIVITAAAILFALPAFAQELIKDTVLGKSLDEVKASLTSMGYEVRKGEMEDGLIEVYFVKGDQLGEAYVDATTGKLAKLLIK
jgi:hypothetical protein